MSELEKQGSKSNQRIAARREGEGPFQTEPAKHPDKQAAKPKPPTPDLAKICAERAGTMIGDGYAWCDCGIEPVRRDMGHRTCKHC